MTTDYELYLRVVLSLGLVLGLIGLFAFLARKFGSQGRFGLARGQRRLGVVEIAAVDQRRRLVLIRRDGVEHLILIGGTNDLVIESAIAAAPADSTAATPRPGFSRQLDEVRF